MSMTSKQVLDLIAQRNSPGFRGLAESHRRRTPMTPYQRELLDALDAAHTENVQTSGYAHPELAARSISSVPAPHNPDGSPGTKPVFTLSAADVAWLSRLPQPDQVTLDDARELAKLAAQVTPGGSDARLVNSIWAPVKTRHDLAKARHDLAQAQTPEPEFSHGAARAALADAIAAEVPALSGKEVVSRAVDTLSEALSASPRTKQIADAEQVIAELDQAAQARKVVNA